jgi:hypothetical protein
MKTEKSKGSELSDKIMEGLRLSYDKMILEKIAKDQSVVMMHKGKMITIKAAEVCNLK